MLADFGQAGLVAGDESDSEVQEPVTAVAEWRTVFHRRFVAAENSRDKSRVSSDDDDDDDSGFSKRPWFPSPPQRHRTLKTAVRHRTILRTLNVRLRNTCVYERSVYGPKICFRNRLQTENDEQMNNNGRETEERTRFRVFTFSPRSHRRVSDTNLTHS